MHADYDDYGNCDKIKCCTILTGPPKTEEYHMFPNRHKTIFMIMAAILPTNFVTYFLKPIWHLVSTLNKLFISNSRQRKECVKKWLKSMD